MDEPLVSVVVPTYNRHEMLRDALGSLLGQSNKNAFSFEIIVIDNASSPPTKAVVDEVTQHSKIPIRYVRENTKGYSEAINRGVSEARGNWIAFFDDDELAEPDWLEQLLSCALETKTKCAGGSCVLNLSSTSRTNLGPVCLRILGEHDFGGESRICDGKLLPGGGNLLVASDLFDSIGAFDTSMKMGGPDSEFITRAQRSGFPVSIAPNAVVTHRVPMYRIEPSYFRWTSLRHGCLMAQRDSNHLCLGRTSLLCIARIGQSTLVHLPLLLLAYLKRDSAGLLDRKCLLWRALGYMRGTLRLIAPRVFPQQPFFAKLEFRNGQRTFVATVVESRSGK